MIETIGNAIAKLVDAINLVRQPHEIIINYPAGSPAAGTEAGRFLLQRTGSGASYEWRETARGAKLEHEIAMVRQTHAAKSLDSLVGLLMRGKDEREMAKIVDDPAIFVDTPAFMPARIDAPYDVTTPALGKVNFGVGRHPTWLRWAAPLRMGREPVDLTHEQLADLLLDNAEDLVTPQLATMLASFRAAKTVTYDGDFNSAGGIGVRVAWAGQKGESTVSVPRLFEVKLPSYSGIWDEGESPMQIAKITVRVMPPKKGAEDAAPTFRLTWINAAECETQAAEALASKVRREAGDVPVYLGVYSAERFVMPTR